MDKTLQIIGKVATVSKDGYIKAVDLVHAHPHVALWIIAVLLVAEIVAFAR
jgi:hypothetical protein